MNSRYLSSSTLTAAPLIAITPSIFYNISS
jgi:hypothetical protein